MGSHQIIAARTPVPPAIPSDFTGLILWLKADALALSNNDPVASWTDSSGNANHATQGTSGSRPVFKTSILNSKAIVRFDGSDDFLKVTNLAKGVFTMFYVYNMTTGGILAEQSTNAGAVSGDYHYNPGGAHFAVSVGGSGGNLSAYDSTSPTIGTSAWLMISRTFSGTHAGHLAWVGGVAVTPGGVSASGDPGTSVTTADYYIGGRAGSSLFMAGDIAEIIVYDNVLSSPNRVTVETYLTSKYAL